LRATHDVTAKLFDPPELASGVKKILGCPALLANNLIHLPDKLAGVVPIASNHFFHRDRLGGELVFGGRP
jgi:hypothetical protein